MSFLLKLYKLLNQPKLFAINFRNLRAKNKNPLLCNLWFLSLSLFLKTIDKSNILSILINQFTDKKSPLIG